jgi:hypothetical protein
LEYTYDDLKYKRKHHPAWRLLQADNSALILSFLGKAFKEKNQRTMTQENLLLQLEDYLYDLRLKGEDYPRSTKQYLEEWAKDEKGWIRKFYPPGRMNLPLISPLPPKKPWNGSIAWEKKASLEQRAG